MAKVIVVGGGLAGLTAAFRLCGDTQVQVFEAAASLGGQIRTDRSAGFAIRLRVPQRGRPHAGH